MVPDKAMASTMRQVPPGAPQVAKEEGSAAGGAGRREDVVG